MVSHEVSPKIKTPETRLAKTEIPKSTEIYRGDINDAVITVQQITGFEITPDWWMAEVGNDGPTEDILKRFDTAFEKFVHSEMGIDDSEAADSIKELVTPAEIVAEAEAELTGFDESVPEAGETPGLRSEFIDDLTSHLKEKYYPSDMDDAEREDDGSFRLTTPTERLFMPDEPYRFLVHVPLGDVAGRGDEIGSPHEGVLMTSLVTNQRQGTFQGYGGFILRQPKPEQIRGMSAIDVGGEVPDGQMDSIERLAQPGDLTEYNQIDVDFDGTAVEAVLIKVTADGKELGRPSTNDRLRRYAEEHDLPVVEIEVEPMDPRMGAEVREEVLPNDKGDMLYVSVPVGDGVMQCRVLRASSSFKVYNKLDGNRLAGTSKINKFGEYDQILNTEEEESLIEGLRDLQSSDPRIRDEDIASLQQEIRRLRREQ